MERNHIKKNDLVKNYGLRLGAASVLISAVQYAMGQHLNPNSIFGTLSFALIVVAIVLGIKKQKAQNQGMISFGESVKIGVGISLVSAVIVIVYNQLFMNYIEPDFMEQILQMQEEEMFQNGLKEEDIEMAMEIGRKMKGPIISSAIGLVASAFFGFVIAAIAGLFLKNNKPS